MEEYNGPCEAGCMRFHGGEVRHVAGCGYYSESLTKFNADRIEAIEAENARLRGRTDRAFSSFFVGGMVGVAITFIAAVPVVLFQPSLPLVAFACDAIGLKGAVNLDDQLLCVQDAITYDDALAQILDNLQAGLDRAALKQEGGE